MEQREMIEYVRRQRSGVISTLGSDGGPQAAFVTIAVTDRGEFVFDAKPDSRKVANLRRDPRIAVVVGGADGTTLQCQGVADFPQSEELERCSAAYVEAFPEFAQSLRDGTVVVLQVRLDWARYGDYREQVPAVVEVRLDPAS
ncbi:pyridoxamine 5'-phosphate oxidase family protein [Streptomyces sp. ISL-90]|nr:pyridoxamine 5'-phosphate oxidase family protein [Streptomyces sp. ISL-90]